VIDGLAAGAKLGSYDLARAGTTFEGPDLRPLLPGAPWADTWPAPGSTLDLDFVNNRGWVRGVGQGGVMDAITFTRASNGTFVGEDGLLKGAGNALGNNLLPHPQNPSFWAGAAIKTDNVSIAPDGTKTAGYVFNTSRFHSALSASLLANTTYTISVWLRRDEGVNPIYTVDGSGIIRATFNPNDEWQRYIVTFTTGTNTDYQFFQDRDISGQAPFFVWGAQLELGSTATEYFPTNIGQPRFDWASQIINYNANSVIDSEDFLAESFTRTNLDISSSVVISPDGYSTAQILAATSDNGQHFVRTVSNAFVGCGFVSCFFKKNPESSSAIVRIAGNTSGAGLIIDLDSESILTASAVFFPALEPIADGWFRASYQLGLPSNGEPVVIRILDSSGNQTFSGSGQSVYAWGLLCSSSGTNGQDKHAIQQGPGLPNYHKKKGGVAGYQNTFGASESFNGIFMEMAATNRLLWCRDGTNAVWSVVDITQAKDYTGIDGVANSCTRLTATADGGQITQSITLTSGTRTASVFLKSISGTPKCLVTLNGSDWFVVELSNDKWERAVVEATLTNPVFGIKLINNGDQVAFDFSQLEDGGFATSPIFTTSSASTRARDFATITSEGACNNFEGSFFARFASTQGIVSSTSIWLRQAVGLCQSNISPGVFVGSLSFFSVFGGKNTGNNLFYFSSTNEPKKLTDIHEVAFSYQGGYSAGAVKNTVFNSNGTINPLSGQTEGTAGPPFGNQQYVTFNPLNTFYIGCAGPGSGSGGDFCGYIQRVIYWPTYSGLEGAKKIAEES
jgi:hypothetical protein